MSLTSFGFFLFLIVAVILFYLIKPVQKYILLAASFFFYIVISPIGILKVCTLILSIFAVTYFGAVLIEHVKGISKKGILIACISILATILVVTKYVYNVAEVLKHLFSLTADFSWLKFSSIIGISYYMLSAIGYLVDVYWGECKAEKNPADVALFIFYFPQLISGPISRFRDMQPQFNQRLPMMYDNITMGIRRMLWGYFKKLVISDRIALIVTSVYGNYQESGFFWIAFATVCYAIQLYTDFSGCMDIIMGTSTLFGVCLPENFRAPFFSETIQEFWQRWHITLGGWFKNYVMYPAQKSGLLQRLGKWAKKHLGKTAGKKIPFYLSLLLLWFLIGLWHGGTSYFFLASGAIPCFYLIISDLCQPITKKVTKALGIKTDNPLWKWYRRIRTVLLICGCWLFICSGATTVALDVIKKMCSGFFGNISFMETLNGFGLGIKGYLGISIGVIVLFFSDAFIQRGTTIFNYFNSKPFLIRAAAIYIEVIMIVLLGMIGSSSFIYFQF